MIEFKLMMLAMAAALAFGVWASWRQARRAAASRGWPATRGAIECSEPVRTRTSRGLLIYEPRIEYAYRVNEHAYRNNELTFGKDGWYTSSPKQAEARCRQYPVGTEVDVYFDPACPELACLERAEGSVALAYVVPVIFAVGSTALFWYVLPTL